MQALLGTAVWVAFLLGSPLAHAQDGDSDAPPITQAPLPPPPPPEDELPIPTLTIDRVPPSTSMEFAAQVSYGQVAYFQDRVPPWVGFGFRGGWGKNFALHRIGVAGMVSVEGDFGVHTLLTFEPTVNWDFVSNGGLLLGVGVGPSLMHTRFNATSNSSFGWELAPAVMARIGGSQTWSRVGRRLFVYIEPKVRLTNEGLVPLVSLAVGSGSGR